MGKLNELGNKPSYGGIQIGEICTTWCEGKTPSSGKEKTREERGLSQLQHFSEERALWETNVADIEERLTVKKDKTHRQANQRE